MKIQVLYFAGCPNHEPTLVLVRRAIQILGVDAMIDELEVTDLDDPAALKFVGSPTVLIDGQDIDPVPQDRGGYGFGCRTYNGNGVPSEAMIESALRVALK